MLIWAVRQRHNADAVLARLHADIARIAGEYLARCADEGQRVDFFAGVIAATAEHHGRTLATYSPFQYPLASCELVALSTVLGDAEA